MLSLEQRIARQIDLIESILKALDLYSQESPPESALNSSVPFCYDQLLFHEWLQWVLLPKTRHLLAYKMPLPSSSNIHAVAEIEFTQLPHDTDELLLAIRTLDELFKQSKES
ncbi:MAG TPA: YqcC family protein [Gammaproteobacteria bacterium]